MTTSGFFCAAAGVLATVTAANDANRPSQMLLAWRVFAGMGVF
jgi:hypothetical protein